MAQFDVDDELIRRLAALLVETGLGEIEYAEGERRIRVARGGGAGFAVAPMAVAPAPAETPAAAEPDAGDAVIAPMVGTVYVAPEPGAEPFVRPGDTVTEGQALLLIEAMKTFNPIRSPRAGKIARILVGDATPVEYGEVLIVFE